MSGIPRYFREFSRYGRDRNRRACGKLRDVMSQRFSARVIPTSAGGEFTWPPTSDELDAIEVIALDTRLRSNRSPTAVVPAKAMVALRRSARRGTAAIRCRAATISSLPARRSRRCWPSPRGEHAILGIELRVRALRGHRPHRDSDRDRASDCAAAAVRTRCRASALGCRRSRPAPRPRRHGRSTPLAAQALRGREARRRIATAHRRDTQPASRARRRRSVAVSRHRRPVERRGVAPARRTTRGRA